MILNVATPIDAHAEAMERIRLPRTLMGGTKAMRKAGELYLPREAAESIASYNARLNRSFLFNAFRKTVADMTGKVFRNPLVLKDDVPTAIKSYAENIDLTGRHINVFARDVFYDALQSGIGFILTDMPPAVQRPDGLTVRLADEKAAGIRPYLVHIPVERVLGWKSEMRNGVETLTQMRFKECASETEGQWGEKEIEQIRVLEPGMWQTWRKPDNHSDWMLFQEGTTSLSKIAVAPVYLNRREFMQGEPPLGELADLNVAHWQSQSDQRNILHVARVPILFGSGFKESDTIEIGASAMVRTSDASSKLEYVEHNGAAIGAGDNDIRHIESLMQNMGLQLLVPNPGQTATGEIRDNAKENSPLAMMGFALQDALEMSLGFMAEYMGLGEDKGGSIEINKDYGITPQGDLATLLSAVNSGQLSQKTFWSELQRRDVLSDSFDPDVEKERLDHENATGGFMNLDNVGAAK